ncbi:MULTISPECIES: hypothetical protein [unclassified Streptomyces]|uniref:hypothetical protein n=1 Tax=unclassified Streptomyces TaxID=2593676 RepID=UPI003657900E
MPDSPDPTVQPTGYVVSCVPEGHVNRWNYTLQIKYRGGDRWTVQHGPLYLAADGSWSRETDFGENDSTESTWMAEHGFDHDTALRLAKEAAPRLSYGGHDVAAALIHHPA